MPELLLELSLRGHLTSVFVNPTLTPIVSSLVDELCPSYEGTCVVLPSCIRQIKYPLLLASHYTIGLYGRARAALGALTARSSYFGICKTNPAPNSE